MSEKIYAWLVRLYPTRFREAYAHEVLQLFRDRARHERGFFARLRLWLDLVVDLAISVPRQYSRAQADLIETPITRHLDGGPSFRVLESQSLRPGALLIGGVLSLFALVAFPVLLTHRGNYRQLNVYQREPAPSTPRSGLKGPATPAADAVRREAASFTESSRAVSGFNPGESGRHALASRSRLPAAESRPPQTQPHQPEAQRSAGAIGTVMNSEENLDSATRHRVVAKAIEYLKRYYVDAAIAQQTADSLLRHETSRDDDTVSDGSSFAQLLTRQMQDVSRDPQLLMIYQAGGLPDGPTGPTPEEIAQYRKEMLRNNCTFEKVEVLPHNIGYLKLNSFPDPSVCKARAAAAMATLNNANAIIFDLRDNRGGSANMVALIAGYLFDHPTHLNDFYNRGSNSTDESWTLRPPSGNKLSNKPAYVLTSAASFSAAEGFSYDLKMLKRATLVGETTSGRRHMGMAHRIDDHFMMRIPGIRVINPISKTNWEGIGVEPDVRVSAADALQTAQKLADNQLHKK